MPVHQSNSGQGLQVSDGNGYRDHSTPDENKDLLYKNDTRDGYKDGKRIMIKHPTIFQACKVDACCGFFSIKKNTTITIQVNMNYPE